MSSELTKRVQQDLCRPPRPLGADAIVELIDGERRAGGSRVFTSSSSCAAAVRG